MQEERVGKEVIKGERKKEKEKEEGRVWGKEVESWNIKK